MSDAHEESEGRLVDLSQNAVNERLWQRASAPLGVIDVRYAQQKYFRFMQWLGQRTALLDHLRSRYRVEEMQAGGEPLFAAPHPSSEPANIFSTTIQSISPDAQAGATPTEGPHGQSGWGKRPSGLAEVLAAHSAKPGGEPEASPEGTYRISRRPPAKMPEAAASSPTSSPGRRSQAASSSPSPPAETTSPRPAQGETTSPRTPPILATEKTPPGGRMAERPATDQAVQGFVFQKRITESPEAEAAVENRQANVQLKRADAALRSEQGRADSRDAQRADRKVVSDSSSNDAAAPALPLVKPLAGPADREAAIVQPRGDAAVSPPIANAPAAPLTVRPPLLSRRRETARESQPADVAAQSARAVTARRNPLTLVAPEIQNDSANLERPEIIWRKPMDAPPIAQSDAPRAAHLTAQGVTVAPAAPAPFTPAAAPSGQASGLPGTPARAQTQSAPVQVEQLSPQVIRVISERVMQAIMLDLKLERERKGINKWR
ncbi:MAG TPA: hypothetical protein VJ464_15555 [Blastocatellia bacterium]|nr:hypothetical protein [Blastocatellia bacterium]